MNLNSITNRPVLTKLRESSQQVSYRDSNSLFLLWKHVNATIEQINKLSQDSTELKKSLNKLNPKINNDFT